MNRAKLVSLSLVIVLLLSFGGTATAQDQTELTLTWWGSQNRHDRTIQVIEMFEAEHPEIDIVYEFVGWGDYWTKVGTQVAGGNMACVMQQDYARMTEWAQRDLLMPLDDLLESGAINVEGVADAVLASGTIDGKLYGLSLGTNSQTYILDADAFAAAGIDLPPPDWTWGDFEEIANKLHEELGIWAIAYNPEDDAHWKSLILSTGQLPFNEDGTGFGYTDDQPVIDYFSMLVRLIESGAMASRAEALEYTNLETSPIVTGDEAMRYQWSNQIVALWTAAGADRNFVLQPMPRIEGGQPENYLKPSMFFSITEGCETVDEAAMFIDYFTNSLEANEVLFAERGVPISPAVREHLLPMLEPPQKATFEFLELVEQDSSPIPPPDPVGWGDVNTNVYAALFVDPVLFGQISVEEGVAIYREEGEKILAEAAAAVAEE